MILAMKYIEELVFSVKDFSKIVGPTIWDCVRMLGMTCIAGKKKGVFGVVTDSVIVIHKVFFVFYICVCVCVCVFVS